jgi:hypothetical protein
LNPWCTLLTYTVGRIMLSTTRPRTHIMVKLDFTSFTIPTRSLLTYHLAIMIFLLRLWQRDTMQMALYGTRKQTARQLAFTETLSMLMANLGLIWM